MADDRGSAPGDAQPGREVGRPRSRQADRKILEATLALVRDRGPAAVTVEGVAALSGTAKTTIYRRYGNSDELLEAALDSIVAEVPAAPEGEIDEQLTAMLAAFQYGIERRIGRPAAATLLGAPDSAFARAMRQHILAPRIEALRRVVETGQQDGSIASDAEATVIVNAVVGSYFTELLTTGHVHAGWIEDALRVVGLGPAAG